MRRGDPIAGQIFLEVDHLNGTVSLYTPAPAMLRGDDADRRFELRLDKVDPPKVRDRVARESDFDPDLWVISLELRSGEIGVEVVAGR